MSLTGGELNRLNGDYGISDPKRSVPIIKLIREHKPKSNEELVNEIKNHFLNKCDCGIESKGTIEDFGQNLYEAQLEEWGRYKYTLKECINWEYNLFVIQSLKGNKMETKAIECISKNLYDVQVEEANSYIDEEMRVDLVLKKNDKTIMGIQVKPISFDNVRKNVQGMNFYKNTLFNYPVYYMRYDYDTEKFINIEEFFNEIQKLTYQ